ncbi:UNVERIFIED_CONTAM: hypothetical protein K2H54_013594 [Gekko kuhli]
MAAAGKKGVFWQEDESELMYRVLYERGFGDRVMCSTHMETLSVFEEVASALTEAGHPRYAAQCRTKFKRDKAEFYDALEYHHGIPPVGGRPPRFNLLRRLWDQAGNPSWELRRPARSSWPKRTCRQAALDESPERGMGLYRNVGIQATESPEASEKGSEDTGEIEEAAPEAALEPPPVDETVVRTNLLELGMRRLQRQVELQRLNEAIAAQTAAESEGEEEEEEEAEEERA